MIKEVIVVEGKDDTRAIQRAVRADTIETGGSAIDDSVIQRIQLAQERRGVIILTDPDHAGERIRKIISAKVPGCKHAFLSQEETRYHDDIGVENASPEAIRNALAHVKTEYPDDLESQIDWQDLIQCGLILHPEAAKRRMNMGKLLRIGYCNGKQFYHRCRVFQISREEFFQAYEQLNNPSD